MDSSKIIEEARSWIGTPFHHQARVKGVGVDCLGLVVSVISSLGGSLVDRQSYSRYPTGNYLIEGMREQFLEIEIDEATQGDVLVMAEKSHANHVMILTADKTVIHSYFRNNGVVEQPVKLYSNRIIGAFRYEW